MKLEALINSHWCYISTANDLVGLKSEKLTSMIDNIFQFFNGHVNVSTSSAYFCSNIFIRGMQSKFTRAS